ncbi:MAG: M20/M25/M40 family metallo-hydrolase, partial [Clostridia bacterium]|nr:M20/M25/M40 family metallo-hydrolase [Clostridia bacterium]
QIQCGSVENWKYEKFTLTKEGNKLYGLGVCDMKSGIAAIISAISQIDFQNLKTGIKIYLTYDEEIGFSGIKDVLKYEKDFPSTIIVGEPTNNEIVVGSKGLMEYEISFKGVKAHSSTPEKGENAIMRAVAFINELNEFYEAEIKNNENNNFEIPYTTMNIGKIEGGSAINSVPDICKFLVDFRTIGKEIETKISDKVEDLSKKYNAEVKEINKISAFLNEFDRFKKTSNFITEASFLKNRRIILGAGPITAHEVDEYIISDSLHKLVMQYKELIEKHCK